MDFTVKTYKQLLAALIAQGHTFQPYAEFLEKPSARAIILRHDVEARYGNALAFAKIQHGLGIRGTYYFRFLPGHFDTEIIREIAALGHETGYHYDDLSHCKGDYDAAIKRFEANLATLRKIAPVKTICMEGAPLSKWDNRDLWGKHQIPSASRRTKFQTNFKNQIQNSKNPEPFTLHASRLTSHYRDYGIIGEPYFDTDFSKVMYLTDTGRRWDGKASVRDKVGQLAVGNWQSAVGGQRSAVSGGTMEHRNIGTQEHRYLEPGTWNLELAFHSTKDIIKAASLLPDQVMFTFHPQRWTDKALPWLQELLLQNIKNVGKRIVLRFKS